MVKKTPRLFLALIGILFLLIGAVAAFMGPIEMYCFYLFGPGGRFYFEGFGFGSLVFALIAWQIIGYYAIAGVFLPLSIGHLRLLPWARVLTIALLWCGLIFGAPLSVLFFALLSFKDLSAVIAIVSLIFVGLTYLLVPWLLIRFYNSSSVRQAFEAKEPDKSWIEGVPIRILVLGISFLFHLVIMHVSLFFNSLFPMFGVWLSDFYGALATTVAILILACLTWGVFKRWLWAWWASVAYLALLALSWIVTLARSSLSDILAHMTFPPTEMEIFSNIPLNGAHLVPIIALPLVITLVVLLLSKRHFCYV